MHLLKDETRREGRHPLPSRAPEYVNGVDVLEFAAQPLVRQARVLQRRFGLTAHHAQIVAQHAFQNGRPT